jgi:hypothetical protein
MFLEMDETVNVDASPASAAEIDPTLVRFLNLKLGVPAGDLVELDCGGLAYCSRDGSGVVASPPEEGHLHDPFPACCDPDANGLGNLRGPGAARVRLGPGGEELSLNPNATSTQIGSGDTWIVRSTNGGAVTETPVTLAFVFNAVPALARWSDGAGGGGSVSYPVADGGPGTRGNPIPIRRGPTGDYVLEMTLFRPQRKGIAGAGEPAFMDLGHLRYAVQFPSQAVIPPPAPGSNVPVQCSKASLSTADPSLRPAASPDGVLEDQSSDRPASPANTLAFSVDLSRCVADKGGSLGPGSTFFIHPEAFASGTNADHALQTISLVTE